MAWLEQCEVCGGGGGGGLFCCHCSSRRHADLNQAEDGGSPGFVQEFQFLGRPGEEMAWLLGGDGEEGVAEERGTTAPPVAPAAWDLDGRWPALDDGGCSVSAGPKDPPDEAGVAGSAAYSAGGAALQMPYFFGGADPHGDATDQAADKVPVSSSGKDDGGGDGGMDREARVLRYREKKKRRKFGKQIRYASRKAYAEARPRIRGRFVKAPDAEEVAPSPPAPPPPLPLLPPQYYDAEQRIGLGFLRAFRP